MQKMMRCREDAKMSYGEHYVRNIRPFCRYIERQMEEMDVHSPVEMAILMIQQAEYEYNAEVVVMNIMAAAMELIDQS